MKTSKLTLYIFLSLILGTLVGWQFPEIGSKMQPLAQVFLNMIKMVIAPLLFSVIVTGIATHGNMKSLGKLGIKTIVYFATATSFALVIGLAVGYLLAIVGMIKFPIWWVCLAISVVEVGVAAVMFAKGVKETKGANLDEIE